MEDEPVDLPTSAGDQLAERIDSLTAQVAAFCDQGRYQDAVQPAEEVVLLTRRLLGPRHEGMATALSNLAVVVVSHGDYTRAETLYRQALDINREALGPRHPGVATSLGNVAGVLSAIGDYEGAERLHRQELAIDREALGPHHAHVAASMNNLALVLAAEGDHAAAELLFREALAISQETLGPTDPAVASALSNLALVLVARDALEEAEPMYLEALEIDRAAVGPGHPKIANRLSNMAGLLSRKGQFRQAELRYREALEIERGSVGESHPIFAIGLSNLADVCAATGQDEEALRLKGEDARIQDGLMRHVFAMGSERQRLAFLQAIAWATDTFFSLVLDRFPNDRAAVSRALDLVLRRKGVVADALATDRGAVLARGDPELDERFRALSKLRSQIATKALAGPGSEGPEAHRRVLDEWERERELLERDLATRVSDLDEERRLPRVDAGAIARVLPEGSALIEFVRFIPHDFRAVPARGEARVQAPRYLAFVLPAEEGADVTLLDLGQAEAIDRMVSAFRRAITGGDEAGGGDDRAQDEPGVWPGPGDELRRAVFDPLLPALGDRRRVFLSPDGDLTRIPFEVLPGPTGEPLIEGGWAFSYVSTGRDVLRFGQPSSVHVGEALVAADPDFDLGDPSPTSGSSPPPGRRSADLDRAGLGFHRLEGTRGEGEAVGARLGVTPLLEAGVLESLLKATRSPRILHLATHGFFLPDQAREPDRELRGMDGDVPGPLRGPGMENPLLRSGLALAGANTFLKKGSLPAEAEDGILTAEDVSGLDLLATELVVLSACETGLGEVRRGEGVFGLRRAFVLAGARTLVMSLWKVPDGPTRELMEGFYERLMAGEPRADALRGAQLELMKDYPHPWFWGAFICQGDPGALRGEAPERRAPDRRTNRSGEVLTEEEGSDGS